MDETIIIFLLNNFNKKTNNLLSSPVRNFNLLLFNTYKNTFGIHMRPKLRKSKYSGHIFGSQSTNQIMAKVVVLDAGVSGHTDISFLMKKPFPRT